ncbi:hypothetical protein B0H16DRAFT_1898587 [Mycena metata]|uniref:Uncharacterized protein n=1 Tax=Mycena metata TaxID=1033252 RepID=A0AAD7HAF2_9AGAR|nr:hypothetical protein B0H16DRAFT_1898587 [Mycena metata]
MLPTPVESQVPVQPDLIQRRAQRCFRNTHVQTSGKYILAPASPFFPTPNISMKIHIATTLVVVLTLTTRAEAIFCLFWRLFVPNACRWGIGGGGGGGGAPAPPPPPPPPNCGPGTYRWGNGCRNAIGTCPNLPNNQVFSHPKYPCGCQVPNSPFDADAQICTVAPPNGKAYCETQANGASSKCLIQCDAGYVFNPQTVKCIRGSLDGCPAPKQLAAGGVNKGCICLNPSDPPVSALGTKCGTVPYFDPADAAAGLPPPGRRRCIVPPADISNSLCVSECDPGYKVHNDALCVPRG